MKWQIKTLWHNRKESRQARADAEHEAEISKLRFEEVKNSTLGSLRTLREQNHFAELLAESLVRGYERK